MDRTPREMSSVGNAVLCRFEVAGIWCSVNNRTGRHGSIGARATKFSRKGVIV